LADRPRQRLALIRHPRALVADGICYGRLDFPLHPDGIADLAELCARLHGFRAEVLWTSPSRRCMAVADALAPVLALQPTVDQRLLEMDFGAWEGIAWDLIDRAELDRWAAAPADFAAPGGETGAALTARVAALAAMLRADGRDGVVVSHGGPLRLLPALLRGEAPDLLAPTPALGSVTWVES
jgi:alpha-ribazole phosphatase